MDLHNGKLKTIDRSDDPHFNASDIKLIIQVQFDRDDNRYETIKLKSIQALKTTKWDGYALISIKLFCELDNLQDTETLITFLQYHGQCIWRPWRDNK